MVKIEKKFIKYKPFFYLTEQINIGGSFKKIQVYIGKNIPKNSGSYYGELRQKEIKLVNDNIEKIYALDLRMPIDEYKKIEALRARFKYAFFNLFENKKEEFWRKFAIMFIFESNAIEGSRLSLKEVEAIVKKKYIKKTIKRKEILEVDNSIKAFELICSKNFILNQSSIINLHKIITTGLAVPLGYKKANIVVNNKETTAPDKVRESMRDLLLWLGGQRKKKVHPLILAADFHARFEYIHPFYDGNGRVGRLLFIWMFLKFGYGVMLFKNKNRQSYFSALDQADNGRPLKLYRHCARVYKETIEGSNF